MLKMNDLILASQSPRRRELLSKTKYTFDVIVSETDENTEKMSPDKTVEVLSTRKAVAVSEKNKGRVVVGADTVVALDGIILGKPKSTDEAKKMLKMLSGRTHDVFTGVCITDGEKTKTFHVKSSVTFYPLTEKEIDDYVSTGEPMDKAGAYGIQGFGALLVEKISGDYFNIVGLPVSRLNRELNDFFE